MSAINSVQVNQLLSALRIGLSVLGIWFSYRGMVRHKVLARHVFWFFVITLLTRSAQMLVRALGPRDPEVIRATLTFFSGLNMTIAFVGYAATAVLVYGCYAALRDKIET